MRYEAPDDEPARAVRKQGLRLGVQVQGGPFVVTGLPQSSVGGAFGFAARFGYQFDSSLAVHWEPGVSFGLDSQRTNVVVWNSLLLDVSAGQFFVAGGPALAAIWQFGRYARCARVDFGADMMGNETDDALAISGRQPLIGIGQAFEHGADNVGFRRRGSKRGIKGFRHFAVAPAKFLFRRRRGLRVERFRFRFFELAAGGQK